MPSIRAAAELSHPRLRDAFTYWQGKRAGRPMPCRRDIDPTEIPKLLPYVMLVDVLPSPLDFRYRLIGTEIRSIQERDYTGQLFSQVQGKGRGSMIWDNFEFVVKTRAPFSRTPPYVGPERHLREVDNVLLPLSENGTDVNMILLVTSFERRLV